ncbi:hypothetical protein C8J57DRAFT_1533295 [Mycena rebaudengoi]|nr:hypothetical protein C8J57DRAFT_1533295 [Mycena rebaudengoi]
MPLPPPPPPNGSTAFARTHCPPQPHWPNSEQHTSEDAYKTIVFVGGVGGDAADLCELFSSLIWEPWELMGKLRPFDVHIPHVPARAGCDYDHNKDDVAHGPLLLCTDLSLPTPVSSSSIALDPLLSLPCLPTLLPCTPPHPSIPFIYAPTYLFPRLFPVHPSPSPPLSPLSLHSPSLHSSPSIHSLLPFPFYSSSTPRAFLPHTLILFFHLPSSIPHASYTSPPCKVKPHRRALRLRAVCTPGFPECTSEATRILMCESCVWSSWSKVWRGSRWGVVLERWSFLAGSQRERAGVDRPSASLTDAVELRCGGGIVDVLVASVSAFLVISLTFTFRGAASSSTCSWFLSRPLSLSFSAPYLAIEPKLTWRSSLRTKMAPSRIPVCAIQRAAAKHHQQQIRVKRIITLSTDTNTANTQPVPTAEMAGQGCGRRL